MLSTRHHLNRGLEHHRATVRFTSMPISQCVVSIGPLLSSNHPRRRDAVIRHFGIDGQHRDRRDRRNGDRECRNGLLRVLHHTLYVTRAISRRKIAALISGQTCPKRRLGIGLCTMYGRETTLENVGADGHVAAGLECVLLRQPVRAPIGAVYLREPYAKIPAGGLECAHCGDRFNRI